MSETQTSTTCVECEAPIETNSDVLIGEILPCEQCGSELEVVGVTPVALELAPEIEEDWGE